MTPTYTWTLILCALLLLWVFWILEVDPWVNVGIVFTFVIIVLAVRLS